jgi:antitoxin component YwqK of YwqJK toxin-antitoxin module
MKNITFLSFIFLSFSLHAQILEGIANKVQPKDEALKCRDTRFRMVSDCADLVYVDEGTGAVMHKKSGKPYTGICKVCHINGNVEMYLTYQGGRSVGQDTIWYDNGKPNLVRSHDMEGQGKEHGTWKFFREDGSLKWEKNYVMGAEDGESRYYFPDTTIWKIETWSLGQLNGKKQEFYPGNTLKKEIMYLNGEWNGKYITYFKSGMVESEQEYKNGKKIGLSRYYYETGALFYEESHENGLREGETRRFYPKDERKWTVENYKSDMRHGVFEEYYDNEKNTPKYKAVYKKDVVVEEHYFDEFGDETAAPANATNNQGNSNSGNTDENSGGKKPKKNKKDKKNK